jgi:hypothetical protein
MSLNSSVKRRYFFALTASALTCLLGTATLALAQDGAKHPEKWRPKDGTYAGPGKDFDRQCGEFGDVIVELTEKKVSGNEWSCDVTKLSDTAPGVIRLEMSCDDYNLGLAINDPNPYDRKFKEIMLLKKLDEMTIFVRKTSNGKFAYPRWRASYCPEEAQRMYIEAKARNKAEAEQKSRRGTRKKCKEVTTDPSEVENFK